MRLPPDIDRRTRGRRMMRAVPGWRRHRRFGACRRSPGVSIAIAIRSRAGATLAAGARVALGHRPAFAIAVAIPFRALRAPTVLALGTRSPP
jgi:hypothetical protein